MTLDIIFSHFRLNQPHVVFAENNNILSFVRKVLPAIQLTARAEAAAYLDIDNADALSQLSIIRFLRYDREYDAIEVSKIVENWRKQYGVNE